MDSFKDIWQICIFKLYQKFNVHDRMIQFYRPRSRFSNLEQNFLTDVLNLLFESEIPKREKGEREKKREKGTGKKSSI